MAGETPTFTNAEGYQAYVEDFSADLLSKGFHSAPTAQRATAHEGVKGKLVLTELVLGVLARRWNKSFNPVAGLVDFVPRTLDVERCKVELSFVPQEFESSYLGWVRRQGQNFDDLPFEGYIMMKVFEKFAQEKEVAMWQAVKSGSPAENDPMSDVFDGYLEIIADEITATNLTPVATPTGAWTSSNIITTLESMYSQLDDSVKEDESECYLSYELFELYNRAYRDNHANYAERDHDGRVKLDFGNCFLRPTPGLSGSDRVAITFPGNLHYGYDSPMDETSLSFEQNKRAMDFWMDYNIGVQIGIIDDAYLVVNDLT
jgi:hypothetical protein